MKLPEAFAERMKPLLGDQAYDALTEALSRQRTWGLRVNTLKAGVQAFLARTTFPLEPVPWSRDGFRHAGDLFPGRHPDYHAGLYYLQDPSAMLPAELLDPKPGEQVLDLCAAPGGKTAQLAAMMRNQGLLVANDISPKRVKPLARNLQGLGVACAAVLNEEPAVLARHFPSFFDKILLDVPCSGEGMFRKDDQAVKSWLKNGPDTFIPIQREILLQAWNMLKPGGRLVYSTCTYNPDENERNIAWALKTLPGASVEKADAEAMGLQPGRADWVTGALCSGRSDGGDCMASGAGLDGASEGGPCSVCNGTELSGAVRIWPHLAEGEGQFAVRLVKEGIAGMASVNPEKAKMESGIMASAWTESPPMESVSRGDRKKRGTQTERPARAFFQPAPEEVIHAWKAFLETDLTGFASVQASGSEVSAFSDIVLAGTLLYNLPWGSGQFRTHLPGLHAEMPGLLLGEWQNGRFEPSAALLHAMDPESARRCQVLAADAEDISRYLHGETLLCEGERGWTAVLADGFPLGWGKQEDGFMKNRYPKGWRMQ